MRSPNNWRRFSHCLAKLRLPRDNSTPLKFICSKRWTFWGTARLARTARKFTCSWVVPICARAKLHAAQANSYDALQIGRNQLSKGQFSLAEQNIRLAIDHSLSINRFNAAASGYQALAVYFEKLGDQYQSEQARLEAARLFSSSGQEAAARYELDLASIRRCGELAPANCRSRNCAQPDNIQTGYRPDRHRSRLPAALSLLPQRKQS